ncbi:MAG: AMP-binding protein [Pseudomonadota bacterium]|nr:AMP-binding protein [Pseudomonadota bacterium]
MNSNIATRFEDAAKANPKKVVLVGPKNSFTWEELDLRAGGVALVLGEAGIGPGERVAVLFDDPVNTIVGVIGCLKKGCTVTPLHPRSTARERARILEVLKPAYFLENLTDAVEMYQPAVVNFNDPAIILFTSGSTGIPKGVVLSHQAVSVGLDMWIRSALNLAKEDIMISVLPPAHSYGLFGTILAPLLTGARSIILPRFDVALVLQAIESNQATIFSGVATMFRRILESGELQQSTLASLRYATSGAAPCPWDLAQKWYKSTGVRIVRGYGMSELFRPICYSPDDHVELPEAIGRAAEGVELKIMDEKGNKCNLGEEGELWIKSDSCMTKYVDNPEETALVLQEGWFKTGDLAKINDNGWVTILGRKKDVILRGGYTIAAGEVEAVLTSHPHVEEAAVIAMPNNDLGEEIGAYVVLQEGTKTNAQTLIEFCKQKMAANKYPRIVKFIKELPKGPTGKVEKGALSLNSKA